ncbi:SDR family oxidoreductase [Catenuloplanes atrovinosus]|uniref:NADP-dependent 3-hydroxy acid dehydrogenase YdfG n=1 Tax=Catenuloplanes atrovinosus TaxID=137266 RepID=A0AAE4C876_9ACTN|nr:SDR family NAD(P)-dependent oxidoreductase [Catenuloplanes atrovinosus]MDR7275231.1 NADP-dependent 3-hydroxy acid dehydrogenase YdfG [Catenuloplanes atrovinosus]
MTGEKTLVLVGAGPRMGLSIATVFGAKGFRVALISRSRRKLDGMVARLRELDIEAGAFPADVTDAPALTAAFTEIKERYGRADVMIYNPAPDFREGLVPVVGALDVTVENTAPWLDIRINGMITAVRQVLPDMREAGSGTILIVAGGSAIDPAPGLGNAGLASGAQRHWAVNLHKALDGSGVHVAFTGISGIIGTGGPRSAPEEIAPFFWDVYAGGTGAEHVYHIPASPETAAFLAAMRAEADRAAAARGTAA